jgi:hypothetical protein
MVCLREFIKLLTQFIAINNTNVLTPDIRVKITISRMVLAFQENSSFHRITVIGDNLLSSRGNKFVDNSL